MDWFSRTYNQKLCILLLKGRELSSQSSVASLSSKLARRGDEAGFDVIRMVWSWLRQSLASSVTRRPSCVRPQDSERKSRRELRGLDTSIRGPRKAVSRQ